MTNPEKPDPAVAKPKLGHTNVLLLAGLMPLPWFLIWTTFAGWAAPTYSMVGQPARELSLVPGLPSWMLSVGAIGAGVALLAFSEGLRRCGGRGFAWGALAWAIYGVSMISNGCWPMTDPRHGLYGVGLVAILAPALSTIDLGRSKAPSLLRGSVGPVSFALVAYWWAGSVGLDPEDYQGVTQRVFFAVRTLWPLLAAITLIRSPEIGVAGESASGTALTGQAPHASESE